MGLSFFAAQIAVLSLLLAACGADRDSQPGSGLQAPGSGSGLSAARSPKLEGRDQEWFVERAEATGLDFVHFNGMTGEFFYPENMPPGVGLLDYDNDGDLDVYLVQGQILGTGKTLAQAVFSPPGLVPPKDRLYRNDLQIRSDGTRTLRFTDVTDRSRIDGRGYGMGVATGDFDNDGWVDLYVTRFGPNQMFRNNGDGTFRDVSRQTATDDPSWSVSASFVDYDRDGWLDLFVGNYLNYNIKTDKKCTSMSGARDYCPPRVYSAQPSRLYRNQGNGTFVDVTARTQMAGQYGPALGIATADFNGDGWIDIYVANDGQENQLWINGRDGTFRNAGLLSGAALPSTGKAEASMGVDAGDFDNDGDEDLFMTELTGEGLNLYVNDGSGTFDDQSARSGLGPASLAHTGFGTAWLDFDNDGWLDILTVNGAITALEALERAKDPFPRDQRKQLFRNLGDGRFDEVTDRAGTAFRSAGVGRGAAFGDLDNDGDVDVLVGNDSGRVHLLLNTIGSRKHWLGLRLVGARPRPGGSKDPPLPKPLSPVGRGGSLDPPEGRDMLGARVEIVRRDGPTLWRRARADGSYASANDPRVLAGLGESTEVPRVRVHWPNGRVEAWPAVAIDRYTTLKEGGGQLSGTR